MTGGPTADVRAITTPSGARYARVMGVGAYRPARIIDNAEVCTWIDSSDEWIRQRSGIETRQWAAPEESVVDMAEAASRQAIDEAGLTGADIDAVVVSTVTWMYQTPSAATVLADRLGATPAPAFDLSAGCAGFTYALTLAHDMVRGGSARHVLVVAAEKLSDVTDRSDRTTAFLFADAAGAVVVGPSDEPAIGPTVWGSDGSQWEAISNKTSWLDLRSPDGTEVHGEWPALRQAGQTVFRWAVWQMAPVAQKALEAAGIEATDLDAFIPHQANVRIIDAMVKQLGLPESVPVARTIRQTGNTSASSVPLALRMMMDEGTVRSGGLVLCIGFGAGLCYGATVMRAP